MDTHKISSYRSITNNNKKSSFTAALFECKEDTKMEIALCIVITIIVSAVVSILMLKFFAYKYFEVIDKYVSGITEELQTSIRDTVSMFRNTTGRK